jgi:hypothetical protein
MGHIFTLALAGLSILWSGSQPATSPDGVANAGKPRSRMQELLNDSFQSGPPGYERDAPKVKDDPTHLTPERVHGGVGQ